MARSREESQQSEARQPEQQQQSSGQVQTSGGQAGGQQRGMARRGTSGLAPWSSSPFSFMRRFSEEMDRLFEDFGFGPSLFGPTLSGFESGLQPRSGFGEALWSPQIEVFQRGDQLVVRADLPGLTKDDVKVEVQEDQLVIEGERRQEHEEGRPGEAHYRSERRYGSFYRSIPLPEGVKADNANASFRNGVLEITIPAPQLQPQGRRIEIQG
jgi:HSP20 family protein